MITEAGPLNLRMGQAGLTCKVHPSVLVTICDSYIRRPSNNVRVIGTLLGNAVEDSVYVKACYTEISEEDDNQMEVKVDVGHHKTMLELHQRVHPKHTVVGWFSTGMAAGIADGIIHKFYSTGQQSGCGIPVPMYLVVDTSLSQSDRVSIKAYVCKNLTFGSGPVGREFVEVPTQIHTSGGEGMALSALASEKLDGIPSDVQNFRQSFSKLQSLIAQAHAYVKSVVDGQTPPDVTIGRHLSDIIGAVPCNDKAEFKKLFSGCTQDIMLVLYLSTLIRSHVSLAEKLVTFALPLA